MGHIIAVYLAHMEALRIFASRSQERYGTLISQLPMIVLMQESPWLPRKEDNGTLLPVPRRERVVKRAANGLRGSVSSAGSLPVR